MFDDLKGKVRMANPLRPLPRAPTFTEPGPLNTAEPPTYQAAVKPAHHIASSPSSSASALKQPIAPSSPPDQAAFLPDSKQFAVPPVLGESSTAVPLCASASVVVPTTRAWVHLHRGDRLGFHGFPNFVVQQIHDALPAFWKLGFRTRSLRSDGVTEFFLVGAPFHGHKPLPHPPRDLVLFILSHLSKRGYHLETSLACSRLGRALDQDTLFFRQGPPRECKWCYVMMHWTDRIRLVGWEEPAVLRAFETAVGTWPLGLQATAFKSDRIFQAKLKGTPWYVLDSPQIASARNLLVQIMDEMEAVGYELVGTVEATMGIGAVDPRTLYFASRASTWPTD